MNGLQKRVSIAAALIFAFLPWATASAQDNQQNDRPPQARQQQQQQRRLAMLAQRLSLTADQKKQWREINRDTGEKIWAARRDESLNENQMQAQIREIHKQHDQRLLDMLSPEQQQALKEFWDEQKQKQQAKAADNSEPASQAGDKTQDDDLFAGMASDDPTPPPPQPKKAGHK